MLPAFVVLVTVMEEDAEFPMEEDFKHLPEKQLVEVFVQVPVQPEGTRPSSKLLETLAIVVTVYLEVEVAVSPDTVTVMVPEVAPVGTVVVIDVVVAAVTVAVVELNFTVLPDVVDAKFVPVIVTVVPTLPDVGVKEVIVGVRAVTVVEGKRSCVKRYSCVPISVALSRLYFTHPKLSNKMINCMIFISILQNEFCQYTFPEFSHSWFPRAV